MMKAYDAEKLAEAVHYVCDKSDANKLGAIKLNKILWFSDIVNYLISGSSITGEEYIKRQFGPVPKHILMVLDQLKAAGKIEIREKTQYGFTKKEYIVLKAPDLEKISNEEKEIIDDMIGRITNDHTALSISEVTHNYIWEIAEIGEKIPYNTVFVSSLGEVNEDDIAWAHDVMVKAAA